MTSITYEPKPTAHCCSPEAAWQWVDAVAEMALAGDEDGRRVLPNAIEHALAMEWLATEAPLGHAN